MTKETLTEIVPLVSSTTTAMAQPSTITMDLRPIPRQSSSGNLAARMIPVFFYISVPQWPGRQV